jgi:hypothetical protein
MSLRSTSRRARVAVPVLGLSAALFIGACQPPPPAPVKKPASTAKSTTTTTKPKPTTTTTTRPATTTTTPTTAASTPPTTTAPSAPAPVGQRNPILWPFESTSPWNTPIGSAAKYETASAPRTATVRNYATNTWMNIDKYSIPVHVATASDPLVTLKDVVHGGSWKVRIPASANAAAGTDANMAVIQPDGTAIDIWRLIRRSSTSMEADSVAFSDIRSSGLGPRAGIRASGLSSLGGLIRRWEVDPTDPNYTDGVIRHALAMSVPPGMLLHTSGSAGWGADGTGLEKGYVWPATSQDWGSEYSYQGNLPMGSLLAIPKSVNLSSLGLDPATYQIAKAMQDYGGYVVDMAGSFNWYAEPTLAGTSWDSAVRGEPNWAAGLRKIRSLLVVVSNNSPTAVGGGGTTSVAAAAPLG